MNLRELKDKLVELEEGLYTYLNDKDEPVTNKLWEADSLITQAYEIIEQEMGANQ